MNTARAGSQGFCGLLTAPPSESHRCNCPFWLRPPSSSAETLGQQCYDLLNLAVHRLWYREHAFIQHRAQNHEEDLLAHCYSSPLRKTKCPPANAKPARRCPPWAASTRTTRPCPWIHTGGTALLPGVRKTFSLTADSNGGGLSVKAHSALTLMSRVRPMPSC